MGEKSHPTAGVLALVDGHSVLHRAFHALPPLTTSQGEPTGALLGFVRMLIRLIKDEKPTHLLVAFDLPAPTFRHEAYAEYKATRAPMDEALRSQVTRAHDLLRALGVPIFEQPGFEADDLLGTLGRQAAEQGLTALIVTGDRDCLQLVSDRLHVLLMRKGVSEVERLDPAGVEALLGVHPDQVTDWKALVGDSSDNLPGVPGIGPKTAVQLLARYGRLEELFAHTQELSPRLAQALTSHQEQAFRVRELARIHCDAPVMLDLPEVQLQAAPDLAQLETLLAQLEFRQVGVELVRLFGVPHRADPFPSPPAPASVAAPVAAGEPPATAGASPVSTTTATAGPAAPMTSPALSAAVPSLTAISAGVSSNAELPAPLADHPWVALQVVADGDDPWRACVRQVTLTLPPGQDPAAAAVVTADRGQLEQGPLANQLRETLADPNTLKIGFDLKTQAHLLHRLGFPLAGPSLDVQLAAYLINPGTSWSTLETVAASFGYSETTAGELAAPTRRLRVLLALGPSLAFRLTTERLDELFWEVEMPLSRVLTAMEQAGVVVDVHLLEQFSRESGEEIARLEDEIYALAGTRFNLNSPRQLADVLFGRLQLPVLKRTKTGPSTSADVLEELADQHTVVAKILDYRQLVKLKSTYLDTLPQLVNPETGRVHTTFNQTVAATGRLSSTNPNLQNIPVRTPMGRRIRQAFVAPPGCQLLSADYSQIELRVLAHLSGDRALQEAFLTDEDIHTRTASEVFGVPRDQVTPEQRSAAKAINFGIIYGISDYGLARGTGLTRRQAQEYIDAYFARYPQVRRYLDSLVEMAREQGYVTTLLKRRRFIPQARAKQYAVRQLGQRMAMNTPIQGSAADIIKVAMVEMDRRLKKEGLRARMLLQVHDELIFEVPQDEVARLAELARQTMEHCVELDVPLRVEIKVGSNWAETQPWQPQEH
ncbi:MAG: DNA polymerase I [Limnochordaceae bacterium]|nr:DNA polymerase I [Limnochordaceae bacterium]